jgi:hypothetical protein
VYTPGKDVYILRTAAKGTELYNQGRELSKMLYLENWGAVLSIDINDFAFIVQNSKNEILANCGVSIRTKDKRLQCETIFGNDFWLIDQNLKSKKNFIEMTSLGIAGHTMSDKVVCLSMFLLSTFLYSFTYDIDIIFGIEKSSLYNFMNNGLHIKQHRVEVPILRSPDNLYWKDQDKPNIYYIKTDKELYTSISALALMLDSQDIIYNIELDFIKDLHRSQ